MAYLLSNTCNYAKQCVSLVVNKAIQIFEFLKPEQKLGLRVEIEAMLQVFTTETTFLIGFGKAEDLVRVSPRIPLKKAERIMELFVFVSSPSLHMG